MKKVIMLVITAVMMPFMLMSLMAGKTVKQWDFQLNDEGECVVEHTFTTGQSDAVAALKAFKKVINKQTFESRSVLKEEPGSLIVYDFKKNTKSRYNPFAGNFREAMAFKMEVRYADGKVYVKLYDLMLENEYQGYGKNIKSEPFSGKIAEYEEAEAELKAGVKGAAKKEASDKMENVSDSFNECQLELNKLFDAIQKGL